MQLGLLKVRFHQKNNQKNGFFGFKTLLLVLDGGCCQVLLHVMKLHYLRLLFAFIVYRRHAASKG